MAKGADESEGVQVGVCVGLSTAQSECVGIGGVGICIGVGIGVCEFIAIVQDDVIVIWAICETARGDKMSRRLKWLSTPLVEEGLASVRNRAGQSFQLSMIEALSLLRKDIALMGRRVDR